MHTWATVFALAILIFGFLFGLLFNLIRTISLTVKWQIYFKPYNQCLEILTWTVLVALGSQTLPREGSKGGGAHSSDEILRADTHVHSDDATYNNNTLKRPGEQGSNGQGMG